MPPAESSAKLPLPSAPSGAWADREPRVTERRYATMRLQNREAQRQQKEQEDRIEQRTCGAEIKALRDTLGGPPGQRLRREEPGHGGNKERKLQRALGTACWCRIERRATVTTP